MVHASLENPPKFLVFQDVGWEGAPASRVVFPGTQLLEINIDFGGRFEGRGEGPAVMVDDFEFEDAHQPGPFGGAAFELALVFKGRQEGFLDQFSGRVPPVHPLEGETKENVAVKVHPFFGIQAVSLSGAPWAGR